MEENFQELDKEVLQLSKELWWEVRGGERTTSVHFLLLLQVLFNGLPSVHSTRGNDGQ